MSSARQARQAARHRAERERKQALRAAALTAPTMTAGAVGVGFLASGAGLAELAPVSAPATADIAQAGAGRTFAEPPAVELRQQTLSRSKERLTQVKRQVKASKKRIVRYATDNLNLRATPTADAQVLSELSSGTRVHFTGERQGGYSQVLWKGQLLWVTGSYLAADRPPEPETMGLSDAPCPDGSVENGLTSAAVRVYRAVCHNFPDIASYGGWDAHGEHSSGKAIDIMHPSVEEGYQIAEFLKAHAAELNLYDVIWRQHIWTPVRSGEGWRSMPDRGSATANHFDHVHVSVN